MDVIVIYCAGERRGVDAYGKPKGEPHQRATVASWTRSQPGRPWVVADVDGVAPEVEYRRRGDENVALDQRRGARMWSSGRPERTYDVRQAEGIYTRQIVACPVCAMRMQVGKLEFRERFDAVVAALPPHSATAEVGVWEVRLADIAYSD